MQKIVFLSFVVLTVLSFAEPKAKPISFYQNPPKLVVVLVIDQFRGDYLTRFKSRFLPAKGANGQVGGFRYLMENGAWFPQGQYDLLQNMTGPGHATIMTGSLPYASGVPVNNWFDRETGEPVYCVEDAKTEVIQTGKKEAHAGSSPKHLIGTTVGDELKNAGYASKVVSIALKDRSAILMGGHRADASLWYDAVKNEWISSRFYFPTGKLPDWVLEENKRLSKKSGQPIKWKTSGPGSGLTVPSVFPFEENISEVFSQKFPHTSYVSEKSSVNTPFGLEVTDDLAIKAIDSMKLGQGKATDLLAVSYSTHDYVVHDFGPNSEEAEEITVSDDRSVARVLNHINKKVPGGLKNVVVVLTADHGIPSVPEYLKNARVPAGRFDENKIVEKVNKHLNEKFGEPKKGVWVFKQNELNMYLNSKVIAESKNAKSEFEKEIKSYLLQELEGVAHIVTSTEYNQKLLPPGSFGRQVMNSYFPGRSGDVLIIAKPFYLTGKYSTTHISGYSYDTTVPILFAGPRIQAGVYANLGRVIDIAPTLSFMLGIIPPAQSDGRVLHEILK